MVYRSENHQVLFATDEYLAGQLHPADRFRDGRTGQEHRTSARDRLLFWLAQRWRYGFSEWNSHYYAEDVAALSDLIDFGGDGEIRMKATTVLDLLLLDVASRAFHREFIATSGRLYAKNRATGDETVRRTDRPRRQTAPSPLTSAASWRCGAWRPSPIPRRSMRRSTGSAPRLPRFPRAPGR